MFNRLKVQFLRTKVTLPDAVTNALTTGTVIVLLYFLLDAVL